MPLDADLAAVAARFVDFVHDQAGAPVIVCDERGVIAHATVRARVGNVHPGAQKILRGEAKEVLVTAEMEAADPRMKQGCNAPILVGGQIVGTFGVAGALELARPLAHVAAGVLGGWIREVQMRRRLQSASEGLVAGVGSLVERVERASAESSAITGRMAAAVKGATERAERTNEVLAAVQRVAAQSRILAINGSVEASRAGDAGRAFAVVAREMLALAEDAKASASGIQAALLAVRTALGTHAAGLQATSEAGDELLGAMGEVSNAVEKLAERIAGLAASFEGSGDLRAEDVALDAAFWALAGEFLGFVSRQTGQPGIVCDGQGAIVRATDAKRIGQVHAGAQRLLRGEGREAAVTAEEASRNPAVREGCSCPIEVGGRRVGTFGITGPLAFTRPLARVAASVLATRVREFASRRVLEGAVQEVFARVDALGALTKAATEETTRRAKELDAASRELEEKLEVTDTLANAVQQLAQQSRIIAVNGSVEAANAGEGAASFGNVARDMLRLADDTARAGKEIIPALQAIRAAVHGLSGAAALQAKASAARGEAAEGVLESVAGMRTSLDWLVTGYGGDG